MKKVCRILTLILFPYCLATIAYADIGAPMIFITLPMLIIGLIPIIIVETFVLVRVINIGFKEAIKISAVINTVSTIIGIPIAWVLLVLVQMITGGGAAYGLQTPLQKFLAVTWQAPWLIPYDSDLYWMLPAACLVLLIPFFFASYLIELLIVRKMLKQANKILINKSVFLANLCSYSMFFIFVLIWLISSVIKGK